MKNHVPFIFVFLTFILAGPLCHAENSDSSLATLKGISVLVIVIEDLKPEIELEGLTTGMILDDTQDTLQSGGVKVIDTKVPEMAKKLGADWLKEGGPFLHVRPHILKIENGRYAYNISAELCQSILLEREKNLQMGGGVTWSTHCFGITDGMKKIRGKINEQVGIFVMDYKTVNP
jgi:hypothetical protein